MSFKLLGAGSKGRGFGLGYSSPQNNQLKLVGRANEVIVSLEGTSVKALIDTGSMVSTISNSLASKLSLQIQPLSNLTVQSASGDKLPYVGFVEASVECADVSDIPNAALFLVVPDTSYHVDVPVLIGTNILECLEGQHIAEGGDSTWKHALKLLQSQRIINGKTNSLGEVKTSKPLVFAPNEHRIVSGQTRVKSVCQRLSVLCDELPAVGLPKGIILTPSVTCVEPSKSIHRVDIELVNTSNRYITIPAKSTLCGVYNARVVRNLLEPELVDEEPSPKVSCTDEDFLNKFNLSETLSESQIREVQQLLLKEKDVFSLHDLDLGHTQLTKHHIQLKDPTPFKERSRSIPPSMYDEVRAHLKEMQDLGVIRPSNSQYASNVVLVRKKDSSLRFCLDLRRINNLTIRDAYNLPRIEETLHSLQGSCWFSALDLKSGYWQVELAEEDKCKTAFTVGPLGFWECNRMPFGLTNAPATFQRLMETCMSDIYLIYCLLYLDDIIVFSRTYEEHVVRLKEVFQRLRSAGLKLKPSKCKLFQRQIRYLGHIISAEGIAVDDEKIECIKNWPVPKNLTETQSFLGFTGFYRRFIKGYAQIAKPLFLLSKGSSKRKKGSKTKVVPPKFCWGEDQDKAFHSLIQACISTPVLGFADYSKPFTLHTDASTDGLGAILYQENEGKNRVIAYASRSLSKSEVNYPAHKLEFLALKWAVTEKFYDYLYGGEFTCYTDNNPLTYILTSAKLDACGQRWVASLANFNFDIKYKAGTSNVDADALSRIRWPTEMPKTTVCAVLEAKQDDAAFSDINACPVPTYLDSLSFKDAVPTINWKSEQASDPVISKVVSLLQKNDHPPKDESVQVKSLFKERRHLIVLDDVLYRQRQTSDGLVNQLVLPKKFQEQALKGLHDDAGHFAVEKTLELVRERFFWTGMQDSVVMYISNCKRCILRKGNTNCKAKLVSILSSQPMELVCIDFLTLEPAKGGVENVLVITDHFTRYAQAIATSNQTAKTTAKVLYENFFCHYGLPQRLHSDQGRNFESKLIAELCKLTGILKTHTTPYHPMGNGQVERFNRTLIEMLATSLNPDKKNEWKSHIPSLVHAYNCTRNDSTSYSPYFLMFGRQPRLPVDIVLNREDKVGNADSSYVTSLKEQLSAAYKLASERISKSQGHQKDAFDKKVKSVLLSVGDRVLVRNVGLKGRNKLADRWKEEVYVVIKTLPDIPVYDVQLEGKKGNVKTYHRNMLLPLGSLPLEDTDDTSSINSENPDPDNLPGTDDSHVIPELEFVAVPVTPKVDVTGPSTPGKDVVTVPSSAEVSTSVLPSSVPGIPAITDAQSENAEEDPEEDLVLRLSEDEEEVSNPCSLRRSKRNRRPPDRYTAKRLSILEAVVNVLQNQN